MISAGTARRTTVRAKRGQRLVEPWFASPRASAIRNGFSSEPPNDDSPGSPLRTHAAQNLGWVRAIVTPTGSGSVAPIPRFLPMTVPPRRALQLRLSQCFKRAESTPPKIVVERAHELASRFIVNLPETRHNGASTRRVEGALQANHSLTSGDAAATRLAG